MADGNIRQFDNPVGGLQPSDLGLTAFRLLAQHQAQTGQEIGNLVGGAIARVGPDAQNVYDKAVTQPGALKAGVDAANMLGTFSGDYEQFMKDHPDDPNAATTWREKTLQPALDKWLDTAPNDQVRKVMESHYQNIYDHFTTTGIADTATRAANNAAVGFNQSIGALSTAAATGVNPDTLLRTQDEIAKAAKGLLATEAQQKQFDIANPVERNKILNSWVNGAITRGDGAGAAKIAADLNSGQLNGHPISYYQDIIQPGELDIWIKGAQSAADRYANMQVAKTNAQASANNVAYQANLQKEVTNAVKFDPNGTVHVAPNAETSIQTIGSQWAGQPGVLSGPAQAAINAVRAARTEEANGTPTPNDPATIADFTSRLYAPVNGLTLEQVHQAEIDGKLSAKTWNEFRTAVTEQNPQRIEERTQLNEWLKTQRNSIVVNGGGPYPNPQWSNNPLSEDAYSAFISDMTQKFYAQRAAGVPALDILNPANPKFLRNGVNMGNYGPNGFGNYVKAAQTPSAPPAPAANTLPGWRPQAAGESLSSYGNFLSDLLAKGGKAAAAPVAATTTTSAAPPAAAAVPAPTTPTFNFPAFADWFKTAKPGQNNANYYLAAKRAAQAKWDQDNIIKKATAPAANVHGNVGGAGPKSTGFTGPQ